MKKIAKKNQIVIATLAVMIAAAGYMNYSGKLFPNKTKTQETNSELANKELLDISDEDASVSSGDMKSQEGDSGSGADSNAGSTDDGSVDGTPGEAVLTNGSVSSVVSQAKVSREQVRSKNKETLQNIIDNKNLSAEEKEKAVNQMVQMTETAEKESAAESLLAAKGFHNSVVSITDEGITLKKIAKKNQIVIATLAVMIAAAGYMNYSGKLFPNKTKTQETNSELANKELLDISDEDASVSSGDMKSQEGDSGSGADSNAGSTDDGSVDGTPGEAVLTNGSVSSVVSQAKVSREQVRSKNKETLQNIIDNKNLSAEEKEKAVNQMVQMTETAEKESAAESLLAAKGFYNSVVSITDDQADVIVGASELSDANRAQIEDIVTRKTGVAAQNIVINPVNADSK